MSARYERNEKARQAKSDALYAAVSNLNDDALDILTEVVRDHTLNCLLGSGDPSSTTGYLNLARTVVNTVVADLLVKGVVTVTPNFQSTVEELAALELERTQAQLQANEQRQQWMDAFGTDPFGGQ